MNEDKLDSQRSASLKDVVKNIIKTRHPKNVAQLAQLVSADATVDEDDFIVELKSLVNEGAIELREPSYNMNSITDYLLTITVSAWFWATMMLSAAALLSIVFVPDLFPISIIRWVLGSIFVLYLPGSMLVQVFFPGKKDFDDLERFALGVGLSIIVSPLIGLILNYLPWGIRFAPVTAALTMVVILFALLALARKYSYTQAKSHLPAA